MITGKSEFFKLKAEDEITSEHFIFPSDDYFWFNFEQLFKH